MKITSTTDQPMEEASKLPDPLQNRGRGTLEEPQPERVTIVYLPDSLPQGEKRRSESAGSKSRKMLRPRPKRNLGIGLFCFVSIQLLVFGLLQWRENLRDPQFGDKKRQLEKMIAAHEKPFVLLALGSSRTGMGFQGGLVSERLSEASEEKILAFNFGIPAVGPVLQLTYLKRLLADGVRPNLLLLEVHPALLSNQSGRPIEKRGLYLEQLRLSELAPIQQYGYLEEDAQSRWWEANLCPTYGARFTLLGRAFPNWLPSSLRFDWGRLTDDWGWNASFWVNPSSQLRESAIASAQREYESMLAELRFEPAPLDALQQILSLAKSNDIPVVLVLMPEGPTFRSWYPPEVVRRLHDFMVSLETPFVDAREWIEEADFLDSHHLLQSGAKHFSERLSAALLPFVKLQP